MPHDLIVGISSGNIFRQEVITWTWVDLDPKCHMVSLEHKELWNGQMYAIWGNYHDHE